MPDKNLTWILAEDFKNQFTPAQLTALVTPGRAPASSSADVEIRSASGFRANACAARFLKQWETARAVRARGIALRRPIAIGCRKSMGIIREAYLIIETIPGAMPLGDFLDRHGPRPDFINLLEGSDLTDMFTAFAAQLRKICLMSVDFHLGDVLVLVAADGIPRLYLADMSKVELKPPGTGRARYDNLRMLDAVLWGRAPSRAQLLFMRMYLRRLADLCAVVPRMIRGLADMPGEPAFSLRYCRENADIKKIASGDMHGYMKRGEHETALLKLLEAPDGLFTRTGAVILKNSRTTAALVLQAPELPWPVYLRRSNPKGLFFGIKYVLRRSRARRAWQTACELRSRHVPTPEPLAFLERRRFGLLKSSYYVTQALPAADSLDHFVEQRFSEWRPDEKRAFIRRLAGQLKNAHRQGMLHGDLKAKNILVAANDSGAEKIRFIDLDAVRLQHAASLSERCRDLARLNCSFLNTTLVSRTQRLLFLKCYADSDPQDGLREAWAATLMLSWRKLLKSGREFSC